MTPPANLVPRMHIKYLRSAFTEEELLTIFGTLLIEYADRDVCYSVTVPVFDPEGEELPSICLAATRDPAYRRQLQEMGAMAQLERMGVFDRPAPEEVAVERHAEFMGMVLAGVVEHEGSD